MKRSNVGRDDEPREKGPEFYDTNLRNVIKRLEQSPWLQVYNAGAELLSASGRDAAILDLGCGTGRFARLLADQGYRTYSGVDFSSERIREARKYVPEFRFLVANLYDLPDTCFERFDVFILLEVLEHIENDLALLERIPKGRTVILSVPNYPSPAHVRHFESVEAIRSRFGGVLEFEGAATRRIQNPRRAHKEIFLVRCMRMFAS